MNARNILVPFLVLVIATSGLTACSSAPNKEAAAAATVAAARSTEAAAVQIIAQATQMAQSSAKATPAQSPHATVTLPVGTTETATPPSATPDKSPASGQSVCGSDPFGNSYYCSPGQGPYGPAAMDPSRPDLNPLTNPMLGAALSGAGGTTINTPTAAPSPTPVVLDTSAAVQIRYGDMITQEIKSSGNMGIFTFDGKAGGVAFLLAVGTADASWLELQVKLYDPQGRPVIAGYGGHDEYELPANGRYVFTVRDAGTRIGPYNVLLKNASPGAGTRLTYDVSISTKITVTKDVHIYSFTGKAGDVVRVAMTEREEGSAKSRQFAVEFLDPDRKSLGGGMTWLDHTIIIEKPLIVSGEYTVRVYATGTLDTPTTGPYALMVKNVAVSASPRLAYGDVITGTIAPEGDKDVYVFEWKAGEKVAIEARRDVGNFNHDSPRLELLDSKGNSLAVALRKSYDQQVIEIKPSLSENGIYVITVEGTKAVYLDTGAYTLSLKNLAAP